MKLDEQTPMELESAAFQRLVDHLRERKAKHQTPATPEQKAAFEKHHK